MAILLKELTIRYSPKGDNLFQLLKDYYAVFGLWQQHQQPGFAGERKTEVVNDVMQQVGKMVHERITKRMVNLDLHGKEGIQKTIQKFNHAAAMEDWSEFTAALSEIVRQTSTYDRTGELPKAWQAAKSTDVSPSLWGLFGGKPPRKVPAWKQFDKPLKGPPAPIQRDLPMAGAQTELPFPKPPSVMTNIPPLGTKADQPTGSKRVPNFEEMLKKFGYEWDETKQAYLNKERPVIVKVRNDTSVEASTTDGTLIRTFANLGEFFRVLSHAQKRRHAKSAATLTEAHYKTMYNFLYL